MQQLPSVLTDGRRFGSVCDLQPNESDRGSHWRESSNWVCLARLWPATNTLMIPRWFNSRDSARRRIVSEHFSGSVLLLFGHFGLPFLGDQAFTFCNA